MGGTTITSMRTVRRAQLLQAARGGLVGEM